MGPAEGGETSKNSPEFNFSIDHSESRIIILVTCKSVLIGDNFIDNT